MNKEYSVNVRHSNETDSECFIADKADWYDSYDRALEEAEKEFENQDVVEVMVAVWEDGDIEDFPLYLRRENGTINQYRNGRLWI